MTLFDDDTVACSRCGGTGREKVKQKGFRKPTLAELTAYCQERSNGIDPQAFLDHYDSNGWKIGGRGPMKDWKSAVRNWERMSRERGRHPTSSKHAGLKEFLANDET